MIQIGKYTPAHSGRKVLIQREFYGQGYIVKDEVAYFAHPEQVCYVPELSDTACTHNDLLALCDSQESMARCCFDNVDWQCPETWIDEQFIMGEWVKCPACRRWVDTNAAKECPFCNGPIPQEKE